MARRRSRKQTRGARHRKQTTRKSRAIVSTGNGGGAARRVDQEKAEEKKEALARGIMGGRNVEEAPKGPSDKQRDSAFGSKSRSRL